MINDDLARLEQYRDRDGFIRLKRTYSTMYRKSNYLCPLTFVQNRIIEYDLKAANISALRASGKVKDEILDKLLITDKLEREIIVGKMRRRNHNFTKIIQRGITRAKEKLFEANLIQDSEILSIKNDAVFIIGRKLKHTKFGPYEFVAKNVYSLYLIIDKTEFYYDRRHKSVDIKGVNDAVVGEQDHQDGMIQFFVKVFGYLIQDRRQDLRKYLIQFSDDYKAKRLPVQYYRELNSTNVYRTIIELTDYGFNLVSAGDSDRDIINGIYNYTKYILPIIQTFI